MVARRKPSFPDLAIIVLEKARKPLSPAEIIRWARRDGILDTEGLTPDKTLYAALKRSIDRDEHSPFRKMDKGRFGLRETDYSAPQPREQTVQAERPSRRWRVTNKPWGRSRRGG